VFKNGQMPRKETQEPPLILGPIYLHWDGTYEAYQAFFAHLQSKLDNVALSGMKIGVPDLLVGSDEEKALLKAVERCFPNSTTFLCCRHLEENARVHADRGHCSTMTTTSCQCRTAIFIFRPRHHRRIP